MKFKNFDRNAENLKIYKATSKFQNNSKFEYLKKKNQNN